MKKLLFFSLMVMFAFSYHAQAQDQKEVKKLKLYGDVRLRGEFDRDSKKTDGTMRADRDRMRFRFRFGVQYKLNDYFEFGGRIRSGNPMNQQSPHVTIGQGFDSKMISIDKAYIRYSNGGFYLWGGKNSMNMWEPDEMLWDGDVNPEGLATGYRMKFGENSKLALNAGYFIISNDTDADANMQTFGKHSNAAFGQLKFCTNIGENKLVIAPGLVKSYTENILGINYQIFSGFIKFKTAMGLSLNIDYFQNLEDYKNLVDPAFEDQKTGFAGTLAYKFNDKFSAKASYAQIQKYAVIDMFAQDDWVRWGNADMTRSSNFGGFGAVLKYNIAKNVNTQLKFWKVEGLKKGTGDNALETGTRVRLDLNIKF